MEPEARSNATAYWFVCFSFGLAGTELVWCCCDLSDLGLPPAEPFSEESGQASGAREVGSKTRGRANGIDNLSSKFKSASSATRGIDGAVFFFFFFALVIADSTMATMVCRFVLMWYLSMRVMPGHCRPQAGYVAASPEKMGSSGQTRFSIVLVMANSVYMPDHDS